MAISVLDVRSTFVPPRIVVGGRELSQRATVATTPRRLPPAVVAAAGIGVVEALGLLAVGLTGLDSVLTAATRPHTAIVTGLVLLLATWVVVAAGSGASMVDGVGRRGYVALAYAELFAVAIGGVAAVVVPLPVPVPANLPLPA